MERGPCQRQCLVKRTATKLSARHFREHSRAGCASEAVGHVDDLSRIIDLFSIVLQLLECDDCQKVVHLIRKLYFTGVHELVAPRGRCPLSRLEIVSQGNTETK